PPPSPARFPYTTLFRSIFLDGVHELDAACQRALLSLLPDGDRRGNATSLPRVISSTSCNFEKEIEAGRFRMELYFRLNGVILRRSEEHTSELQSRGHLV